MNTSIPPRLRAPAIFVSATLIALAIGGAAHGWNTVVDIVPIPLLVVIALYAWGARDCDGGAVIRHQLDERQEYQRLKVQALVGRVRSLAVAIAYVVATAAKAMLWPWAILLGLVVVSFLIGWLPRIQRITRPCRPLRLVFRPDRAARPWREHWRSRAWPR